MLSGVMVDGGTQSTDGVALSALQQRDGGQVRAELWLKRLLQPARLIEWKRNRNL